MNSDVFTVNKSINGKSHKYLWTEEQIDLIYDLYFNQQKSSAEISKMFRVSSPTILGIVNSFNIKRQIKHHRTYSLDENYFDYLDSPNKLYFLGFLFADGCLSNHYEVSITLQEEDSYILNCFKNELSSTRPLEYRDFTYKNTYFSNCQNQYRLRFDSKHLFETLESYGLCRNKSLLLEFPKNIPEQYLRDFIRGYWDGDGYIGKYNRTDSNEKLRAACGITSTLSFCSSVKNILHEKLNVGGSLCEAGNHNGITHILDYGGNKQVKQILDWLYSDSELKLSRKYEKYLSMFYPDLLTNVA